MEEVGREERRVMDGVDEMFMFDILKKSKNIVQFSSVKASLII